MRLGPSQPLREVEQGKAGGGKPVSRSATAVECNARVPKRYHARHTAATRVWLKAKENGYIVLRAGHQASYDNHV